MADLRPSTSRGVSAVPSGSGMTFLLDSSMEEDNPASVIASSSSETEGNVRGEKSKRSGEEEEEEDDDDDDDEDEEEDEEMAQFRRQRELTDKYMAGQVSFSEFVREINPESDDEDEERVERERSVREAEMDEEWTPSSGGRGAKGRRESAVREDTACY